MAAAGCAVRWLHWHTGNSSMALRPPHTHVRIRRWLGTAMALLALAAAYWIALEHVGIQPGDYDEAVRHTVPGLDRHTPRVD